MNREQCDEMMFDKATFILDEIKKFIFNEFTLNPKISTEVKDNFTNIFFSFMSTIMLESLIVVANDAKCLLMSVNEITKISLDNACSRYEELDNHIKKVREARIIAFQAEELKTSDKENIYTETEQIIFH